MCRRWTKYVVACAAMAGWRREKSRNQRERCRKCIELIAHEGVSREIVECQMCERDGWHGCEVGMERAIVHVEGTISAMGRSERHEQKLFICFIKDVQARL
jgi:hypothetical protein